MQESARELCYEHQKLPSPPHAPETRGYNAGVKPSWSTGEVRVGLGECISASALRAMSLCACCAGELPCLVLLKHPQVLYNPNDMEPHVALQIIEKIVRLMQV